MLQQKQQTRERTDDVDYDWNTVVAAYVTLRLQYRTASVVSLSALSYYVQLGGVVVVMMLPKEDEDEEEEEEEKLRSLAFIVLAINGLHPRVDVGRRRRRRHRRCSRCR